MTNWKIRLLVLLLISSIIGILLINNYLAIYELNVLRSLSQHIFVVISAESTSSSEFLSGDNSIPAAENSEAGNNENCETTEDTDDKSTRSEIDENDDTTKNVEENHKSTTRKEKVEEVIVELPTRLTSQSKFLARFPLDFKGLKVEDLGVLARREGELMSEYKNRLNRTLSAMCTLHSVGLLEKDSDWKIFIEQMRLCTSAQVLSYEMGYLTLTEELAVKKGDYVNFLKTSDAKILNIRRGIGVLIDSTKVVIKRDQQIEANLNYNWLIRMSKFNALKNNPDYALLKSIGENTVVDQSKATNDETRLPAIYTEFYCHISFPQELLDAVVIEAGGDPKKFTNPKEVREFLFFLECLKKDPNFLDFKKR